MSTVNSQSAPIENTTDTIPATEVERAVYTADHKSAEQKSKQGMTASEAAKMIDKAKGDFVTHCLMSGIDKDTAYALFDLCKDSPNLRIVYNKVRKQYGNANGRNYFQVIKNTGIMGN